MQSIQDTLRVREQRCSEQAYKEPDLLDEPNQDRERYAFFHADLVSLCEATVLIQRRSVLYAQRKAWRTDQLDHHEAKRL